MTDAQDLTLERCVAIYNRKDHIIKLLKDIGHRLTAELEAGKEVPGYKLVQPVGHRKWSIADEEELLTTLRNMGFLKRDLVIKTTKVASPNQLETLAKQYPKFKDSPPDFSHLITKPKKDPIAVPISDLREAYIPTEPDDSNVPEYQEGE